MVSVLGPTSGLCALICPYGITGASYHDIFVNVNAYNVCARERMTGRCSLVVWWSKNWIDNVDEFNKHHLVSL